ncbi:MAG: hypothetical protein EOM80_12455, partial [Erysipelotrichia bacterium]|nr:hypothetical protein [Erysipelotrichia bacterium]
MNLISQTFFYQSGYFAFFGGICLFLLCAFINTLPSNTREKLELRWSVSAIFFSGLIRILLSFEAIVPFPGCVLLEVTLRILAIQFM